MQKDRLETTVILVGFAVQIFVAGVGWGTVWTKLATLEKRFDRYEDTQRDNQRNQYPSPVSQPWYTITSEARADTTSKAPSNDRGPSNEHAPSGAYQRLP